MITINSLDKLRMACLLTLLILIGSTMEGMGQTIPATNTVTVGGAKTATGWTATSGTTDISSKIGMQGSTAALWVSSPLTDPPNGHDKWISGFSDTESTSTTITGLTVGKTYEFTIFAAEMDRSGGAAAITKDGAVKVLSGATTLATFNFSGVTDQSWKTFKLTFTATATSLPITLTGLANTDPSAMWNVSISADAVKLACLAGTTAPSLSATTITNACPATTVDLTTITASNTPANTELTWHTATPATTTNKIATADLVNRPAGTYFAAFFDAASDCYSGTNGNGAATTSVTATLDPDCTLVGTPTTLETPVGTTIIGKLPIITGGIGAFTYSTVTTSDTGCVAPSGFTAFTGTINNLNTATGEHTITAPSDPGNYFYCIKVCGSDGKCTVSIHKVIVTEVCPAGTTAPTFK